MKETGATQEKSNGHDGENVFLVTILLIYFSAEQCSSHFQMKRLCCVILKYTWEKTIIASQINVILLFWRIDGYINMDPEQNWTQIQLQAEADSL